MPSRAGRRPRRALTGVLAVVALALSGCVQVADEPDPRPYVLTTFTVLADMARHVAGDHLQVHSITKVGAEIHAYEPTPTDIRDTARADLVLDNGLGLEAWFEQLTQDADAEHVVVSEGVEPIDIASDEYAGKPNPHAWMSPTAAGVYVDTMARAFAELDPEHADEFAANARAYRAELDAVAADLREAVAAVPPAQRVLVTCEGAFSYLARDAGLDEQYIWPVNAEQQATPRQIRRTIEVVRERDVPAVFCESTVSDDPMRQVVEETGTRFGGTLYVDSLSEPDGPVPTYLDLLRHDVDVIVAGLTEGPA